MRDCYRFLIYLNIQKALVVEAEAMALQVIAEDCAYRRECWVEFQSLAKLGIRQ